MKIVYLLVLVVFLACSEANEFSELSNPMSESSMFPNVFEYDDKIYISYLHEKEEGVDQLYFCYFDGKDFSVPRLISEGSDWFVNWADIPAIAVSDEGILASWLEKSAGGTYDYDIKLSLSDDEGLTWSAPFIPHRDSIAAEHGFLSLSDDFRAVWLDGRDTLNKQMTLRSALIGMDGGIAEEFEIDNRVCDCCQTAVEQTELGTFALYRNRSADEVRDNYFSIYNGMNWSEPKPIFTDEWKISGCPVNGPVIDSDGSKITAAWYTEASAEPSILIANYLADEERFSEPLLVASENVIGRLDLVYVDEDHFAISWMEDLKKDNLAEIKINIYSADLNLVRTLSAGTTTQARSSGIPKIAALNNSLFVIYTEQNGTASLTTKVIGI